MNAVPPHTSARYAVVKMSPAHEVYAVHALILSDDWANPMMLASYAMGTGAARPVYLTTEKIIGMYPTKKAAAAEAEYLDHLDQEAAR